NDRVSRIEAIGNLIITGEAEAGSTVHVRWGGTERIVRAQSDGDWAADFTGAAPSAGTRPVSAYAVAAAGNVGVTATRNGEVTRSFFSDEPAGELLKSSDLFVDEGLILDSPSSQMAGGGLEAASYEGASTAVSTGPWLPDPLPGSYA